MILYLSTILVAMIITSILNIMFCIGTVYENGWIVVLLVILSVAFQFGIDAIFAIVINKLLPNKWFKPNTGIFKVSKKEQHFYEKIAIKKWKDKVWELGGLGGFSKAKIDDPTNPEYFEQFLVESNKGIFVHIVGMIAGFAVMLLLPYPINIYIGLPVACVNLILNTLPILILRYNTPKLLVAQKRAIRNIEHAKTQI